MKTLVTVVATVVIGVMASIASGALAGPQRFSPMAATNAVISAPEEVAVGDRYLVPQLLETTVTQLPSQEQAGDQYLAERVAVADLVIGERILAAEDLANQYARDLPGFADVLLADGFRQDTDGTWVYDPFSSWMRFPLNR